MDGGGGFPFLEAAAARYALRVDSSTGQASAEVAEGGGGCCNGGCSLLDEGVLPIVDRLLTIRTTASKARFRTG